MDAKYEELFDWLKLHGVIEAKEQEEKSLNQILSLTTLDLSGCKLTFLPKSIGALYNLEYLILSSNQLSELPTIPHNSIKKKQYFFIKCLHEDQLPPVARSLHPRVE